VLYLLFGGGGKEANQKIRADVQRVVRIYPGLKPEYNKAMSDKTLTLSEANSILKQANALTAKGKR